MRKKKLTNRLLAGAISASAMGLSMMTGCGLLSSGAAQEIVQQVMSEEGTVTDSTAQTTEGAAESAMTDEKTSSTEGEEHVSNFRKTDGSQQKETDTASAGDAETDENSIRFTTVDLDGSPVSGSIFQDADLTLVYVWATYCGPCIMEMPDYEELYENLPEGVNLIGLVIDVYEGDTQGAQAAQDILNDAGAKFRNIVMSDSVEPLISSMQFTPSAFFVDRQGHMVGDLMDGSGVYESAERLSELVE